MKRFFEYVGLMCVVCFSFFLTDQTITITKEIDNIMTDIKVNKHLYETSVLEAIIDGDTIIPGVDGTVVNVNKSYNNMKKIGAFNPNLYIYDTVSVVNKLEDNKDKYIIQGNKSKKMISLFIFIDDIKLNDFLSKIGEYKFNFVVSYNYLSEHKEDISKLISKGHNILILETNIDNLKEVKKMDLKNLYCFNYLKNETFLNDCHNNSFYSISLNNTLITKNYLSSTKSVLLNGNFIAYSGNLTEEIVNIINYINKKGYKIVSLDEMLF